MSDVKSMSFVEVAEAFKKQVGVVAEKEKVLHDARAAQDAANGEAQKLMSAAQAKVDAALDAHATEMARAKELHDELQTYIGAPASPRHHKV